MQRSGWTENIRVHGICEVAEVRTAVAFVGRRGKAEGTGQRELSKGAEIFSILITVEVTKFMNLHLKFICAFDYNVNYTLI